jgi:ADP-heptose:LPS heptosyltransferase
LPHYHLNVGLRGVGDTVSVSALVRDLYEAFPGVGISVAGTSAEEVFRYDYRVKWKLPPDRIFVPLSHKPTLDRSYSDPAARYIYACHDSFEAATGVRVPRGEPKPSLFLGADEEREPDGEPYRVVASGVKADLPIKLWPREYFARVVRDVGGRWVQVGGVMSGRLQHHQVAIPGAENLIGKTTIRQLMRLVAHADAVLCHVSLPMLLAAAFGVRCVVPAGGRENPSLYEGLGVDFLDTMRRLPCSVRGGCGVCAAVPAHAESAFPNNWLCKDPVETISGEWVGRCMTLVTPEDVAARLGT